ncbi:MAG: hypothetical protein P8X79_22960 [Reinekea sp.]|jgi:hypothetical protein
MYILYRKLTAIFLYKDYDLVFHGSLDMGFSVYGFEFQDAHGNSYHMKATGMYFWRKMALYKNGEYIETYKRRSIPGSNIKLTSFHQRLMVEGREVGVLKRNHANTENGIRYYQWELSSDEYLVQSFCLSVLRMIDGMQSVNGAG